MDSGPPPLSALAIEDVNYIIQFCLLCEWSWKGASGLHVLECCFNRTGWIWRVVWLTQPPYVGWSYYYTRQVKGVWWVLPFFAGKLGQCPWSQTRPTGDSLLLCQPISDLLPFTGPFQPVKNLLPIARPWFHCGRRMIGFEIFLN